MVNLEKEARKCIDIQSHLSSSLYNWAAAHTFYEQKVICWSTTAAYYAMIHSVRTLFSLVELESTFENEATLGKVLKSHKLLCLFLLGECAEKYTVVRDSCINCFDGLFPTTNWDSFLRGLGERLTPMKEARENENYEHFVIDHHGREYHVIFDSITSIFQKSEQNANTFIPEVLDYVSKFYEKENPLRSNHLWHLKDEIFWLERTLREEKLTTPAEMRVLLSALKTLFEGLSEPTNQHDFEREMDQKYYDEKGEVYKMLKEIAEKLVQNTRESASLKAL